MVQCPNLYWDVHVVLSVFEGGATSHCNARYLGTEQRISQNLQCVLHRVVCVLLLHVWGDQIVGEGCILLRLTADGSAVIKSNNFEIPIAFAIGVIKEPHPFQIVW